MTSRSQELRAKHRRILGWSLGLAGALHVCVLLLTPVFETRFPTGSDETAATERIPFEAPVSVRLVFGPPAISAGDGTTWNEPPHRVLQADRVVELPTGCRDLVLAGGTPLRGRVHLRVRGSGHADVVGLTEGTGDACGDEILATVANDLLYEWLPSERFPAPVELIQPVTLTGLRE